MFLMVFQTGKSDEIIVGGDFEYPPYSYKDPHGNPRGHNIEVLEELSKITSLSFSYRLTRWDKALTLLKEGQTDIITGIVYSEERERDYDFSYPIYTDYYAIFTRKEIEFEHLEDLANNRIALMEGDISLEKFIKPMGLLSDYTYVKSLPEAISKIEYGTADYVIAPYSLGMKTIKENNYSRVLVKGPEILPSIYCFAVKEGNTDLLARLNRGITELRKNGKLGEINSKWFKFSRKRERYEKIATYVVITSGIIALVFLILYFWFRSLKRKVKQKTREIKETEEIYYNLFHSNKDGLILLDLRGNIMDVNPETCKMYGYTHDELIGRNVKSLVSKESNKLYESFLRLNENNEQGIIEFDSMDKNKQGADFHVSIKGVKVRIRGVENVFVVIRDITKMKNTEAALYTAKKKAESASAAKSHLLSSVSHEIRTPLNAVSGYTHLLKKTGLSGIQNAYASKLLAANESLNDIINDVLDLSKMEAGKFILQKETFSFSQILRHVSNIISVLAGDKELELIFFIDPALPDTFVGDPLRIRQILMNLGSNAIKYTHQGEVSLSFRTTSGYNKDGLEYIVLQGEIQDTGMGIPKDKQDEIFEPFRQLEHSTTDKISGTGLGLNICKELIGHMGGDIYVKSQPGIGSTFYFNIPLQVNQNEEKKEQENILLYKPGILIIEDNETQLKAIESMLKDSGFNTRAILADDKSFSRLTNPGLLSDIEVILIDWDKERENVILSVLRHIQSRYKYIKIIALLPPFHMDNFIKEGYDSFVNGTIQKPLLTDELLSALSALFAEESNGLRRDESATGNTDRDLENIRVLVVDDNEFNRDIMTELLSYRKCIAESAASGEEAIRLLGRQLYDVVIMDILMPGMNGFETTECIRKMKRYADLPVIGLSANDSASEKKQGEVAGMNDYLVKPVIPKKLYVAIHKAVHHSNTGIHTCSQSKLDDGSTHHPIAAGNLVGTHPALETGAALYHFNGSEEMYHRAINRFIKNYKSVTEDLNVLYTEGKREELQKLMHNLVNALGIMGAKQLEDKCRKMEHAIKAGMYPEREQIASFTDELRLLFVALKKQT